MYRELICRRVMLNEAWKIYDADVLNISTLISLCKREWSMKGDVISYSFLDIWNLLAY